MIPFAMSWLLLIAGVWLGLVLVSLPVMAWALLTAPLAEEVEGKGLVIIEPAPALSARVAAIFRPLRKVPAETPSPAEGNSIVTG